MKTPIVIENLEQLEKYKKELKQIHVWICDTAMGKSFVCALDDRFLDFDNTFGDMMYTSPDWEERTIDILKYNLEHGKIILNASRDFAIEYLYSNHIPFVYLYGKPSMKQDVLDRMHHRNNPQGFIDMFGHRVSTDYQNRVNDNRATFKIELNSGEYASDYLWRVFGEPKKYIKNHTFPQKDYKMVFCDLERCLVNLTKTIDDNTLNFVMELDKTIPFTIITEYNWQETLPYIEKLGLNRKDRYILLYNGQVLVNGLGQVIDSRPISKQNIRILLDDLTNVQKDNCEFGLMDRYVKSSDISNLEQFVQQNDIFRVVCFKDRYNPYQIDKLVVDRFVVNTRLGTQLDFVEKSQTKDELLQKVLQLSNVNSSQIIPIMKYPRGIKTFDDSDCFIVVANAVAQFKNQAKYITKSHNDGGVVFALKKVLNIE